MKKVKITIDKAYHNNFVSALGEAKISDYSANVVGNDVTFSFSIPNLQTLFEIGESVGTRRNQD